MRLGRTRGGLPPRLGRGQLFTPKYRYLAHQAPRFELDVVSTAARPCSFDVGARNVQLAIRAGGERQGVGSARLCRGEQATGWSG